VIGKSFRQRAGRAVRVLWRNRLPEIERWTVVVVLRSRHPASENARLRVRQVDSLSANTVQMTPANAPPEDTILGVQYHFSERY
jgi:hypothetical protein